MGRVIHNCRAYEPVHRLHARALPIEPALPNRMRRRHIPVGSDRSVQKSFSIYAPIVVHPIGTHLNSPNAQVVCKADIFLSAEQFAASIRSHLAYHIQKRCPSRQFLPPNPQNEPAERPALLPLNRVRPRVRVPCVIQRLQIRSLSSFFRSFPRSHSLAKLYVTNPSFIPVRLLY